MSKSFLVAGVFALALPTLLPWTGHAQDKGEKVRIPTVDGVDLNAKFYACKDGKIKTPPTVLMLHPLGESSAKKPWIALAEKLSEKAAVLTFDFRGHGQSTEIDPDLFWKVPFNRVHVKNAASAAANSKNSIEFKELMTSYYTAFVNDIAACKAYLDRKNDTGACNTSSFILVGAEDGATLGAIWLNSEYHRHRLVQDLNLFTTPDPRPEGLDVIGCVWLSIKSQLGSRPGTVSIANTLAAPLKDRAVPMVFMYGADDAKAKAVANAAIKFKTASLKVKYSFTAAVPVKTKLSGIGLLQPSLAVDDAIYQYLFGGKDAEGVVEAKTREWTEREFRKTQYVWRLPGPTLINAKLLNDTNLLFNDYARYAK